MQEKLKGLAQRLDGLATRFQLHGQFAAADDVRRVASELKAIAGADHKADSDSAHSHG